MGCGSAALPQAMSPLGLLSVYGEAAWVFQNTCKKVLIGYILYTEQLCSSELFEGKKYLVTIVL